MSLTDKERLASEAKLRASGRELSDSELAAISAAGEPQKGNPNDPSKKPEGKP